jgi:tetratricopeptide (TPR) repeat protein
MDAVTAGLLLAVATGASEAAGGIVWDALSSLVRRSFKGKKRQAAVEHLERLQLNHGDPDAAAQLAVALTARAGQDAAFRGELESWQASALRLYPSPTGNVVITGGTQGSVIQAGTIIGDMTFSFTPPVSGAAPAHPDQPDGPALLQGQDVGPAFPPGVLIQIREAGIRLPPQPYRSLAGLPMSRPGFTARRAELSALLGALDPDNGVPVVAVVGPPGVGKTALAIQAGHAARKVGWFPDGVVYLDLHGYDGAALQPEQALASALGALGIAAERIPPSVDEAAAFYRSLLDGMVQPVLIIADNAWPAAQVLPLLPGAARHRLLVTSRHTMTQIRARRFTLAELDEAGAVELLDAALRVADQDDARIAADPAAAARVARNCGYLPLALTIAAAALEGRHGMSGAELASRLADPRTRLDLLDRDTGDAGASVRAAFGFSYQLLAPRVQRVFRLCAAGPGPDLSTGSAIVLAGNPDDGDEDEATVVSALDELDRAHLIIPSADRGRWHMHDLLRDYGEQLADREAAADGREQAHDRLLGDYLDRLQRAGQALILSTGAGQDAITWFEEERLNLMAATALAGQAPHTDAAFLLPQALLELSLVLGHVEDAKTLGRICLDSAERRSDPVERGIALTSFGQVEELFGHADTAIAVFHEAIEILRGLDDSDENIPMLLGSALSGLSGALLASGERDAAIAALEEALVESRRSEIELIEVTVLGRLGAALADGGRYDEAVDVSSQAVTVSADSDSGFTQGIAFFTLGRALCRAKNFPEAITESRQAADVFHAMGASFLEAIALDDLADALWGAGLKGASFGSQDRVVELMQQTEDASAEGIALVRRGDRLRWGSRYADSIPDYTRAIDLFQSVAERHGEADARESLGHAYYGLKQYEQARAAYEQAGAIYEADGDRTGAARVINSQGNALRQLGESSAAIELHLRAADLFRAEGNYERASTAIKSLSLSLGKIRSLSVDDLLPADGEPREVAMALVNLASALLELNRNEAGVSVAERAIALAHGLGEEAIEGRALNAAGRGLVDLMRYEDALEAHQRDLALTINLEDRRGEGIARGNVGLALRKLGRLDEAESEWREACGIFDNLGEPENHGWTLDGLGDVLHGLRRDEEAVTAYDQAIAVLRMTADRRMETWSTFSLACIWWDLRDWERAVPGLARAAKLAWEADLSRLCGVAWTLHALAVFRLWWQRIRSRGGQ